MGMGTCGEHPRYETSCEIDRKVCDDATGSGNRAWGN